ncbi:Hypothetical protein CINCED_3A024712 [Cinara cedri]|uniref:Uncharacterized protein n=1 Tax=Cinara cedri TaxID=506608 RepID=A0A5E4MZB3_9HEMI|nr:Hypothetical protein CINCED_3A024712 [Cinara cedri]
MALSSKNDSVPENPSETPRRAWISPRALLGGDVRREIIITANDDCATCFQNSFRTSCYNGHSAFSRVHRHTCRPVGRKTHYAFRLETLSKPENTKRLKQRSKRFPGRRTNSHNDSGRRVVRHAVSVALNIVLHSAASASSSASVGFSHLRRMPQMKWIPKQLGRIRLDR